MTTGRAHPGRLLALAALLALCGADRAEARPHLSAVDAKKVAAWQVVSYSLPAPRGTQVRRGKALGRFGAPPEAVLHAIFDVGKYQNFLPDMKTSREVRRRKRRVWGVLETKLPWPVRDAWVYIELSYAHKTGRTYEMRWKMINGTMKQYEGYALIEPWGDGIEHSVLTLSLLAEPQTAAPDSVISRGVRKVAEVFTHRLRMRVAALKKYGKLPGDLLRRYR